MKTQWEYDLVEKPFCEQLKGMGWDWLEGDTDVPELTERENFRDTGSFVIAGREEKGTPEKTKNGEETRRVVRSVERTSAYQSPEGSPG